MSAGSPGGTNDPRPGDRSRRRALTNRIVAYGVTAAVLVVFAIAALDTVEAWPVTSFRLFSHVRTDTSVSTTLVAIDATGDAHMVRADSAHGFVTRTASQYSRLRTVAPDRARAMVDAWLESAGMDPADYVAVELRRKQVRLHADRAAPTVIDERTTWRLDL